MGLNFLHGLWSQDDLDILRECAESGLTKKNTALRLGRSYIAIEAKAKKLKIRFKPRGSSWSEEEIAIFKEMAAENCSGGKIAKRLGRTRNAVIGMASRRGVKLNGRILSNGIGSPKRRKKRPTARQAFNLSLIRSVNEAADITPEPAPSCSVTFFDLEPHHCRWPVDANKFCGAPRGHGAYCLEHAVRGVR